MVSGDVPPRPGASTPPTWLSRSETTRRWRFFGHFCQTIVGDSQQTVVACRNVSGLSSTFDPVATMARGLLCRPHRTPTREEPTHMMKHSFALLVTAMTSMLAGCEPLLRRRQRPQRRIRWNYCGSDGYYECKTTSCIWRGPTCPAGGSSGGVQRQRLRVHHQHRLRSGLLLRRTASAKRPASARRTATAARATSATKNGLLASRASR